MEIGHAANPHNYQRRPLLSSARKRCCVSEPSVNAGSRAPVNFEWYSKPVRTAHEPDSLRGRIIRSPFAIFKLTETTVGYSQDSC
jgi:hypothetical protein